ncbi:glycosyl hydrolase family 43 protein [Paraphoma chrysanthemicola]|nr:glycosyl hydrolase family 43 protein [Paraphoma chrysanthemicola]
MFLSVFLVVYFLNLANAIQNPIIPGFNPDPAIIRLGDEYFIATSSFEFFPGFPIYRSTDLQNWELFSHALTRPSQIQLYGTAASAGVWAPSLSYINGRVYIVCATRWTYDPVAKVWPRAAWLSSTDMKEWSDPVWADLWGIDPSLYQDPKTNKTYLNIMAPNNNAQRIWGISQCEVNIESGRCVGPYRSLWNGTLPSNSSARPEGPKMFFREPYHYLLIAEGGTDDLHRATIARSNSPEGPWDPAPNSPLIYNGAYGFNNLTVQSTGHADIVEAPDGKWYASFLARRKVNGSAPLGREAFLTTVNWQDGWPSFNNGTPILLTDPNDENATASRLPPPPFIDQFNGSSLQPEWYRLRTPYTETYRLDKTGIDSHSGGLTLLPNVFSLSDRDQPAALLRKQKSLNMTFSAHLKPITQGLRYRQSVGVSAYLSELQHQDLGVRKCANATGLCVYATLMRNSTVTSTEIPLNTTSVQDLSFHIRATPTEYFLGFAVAAGKGRSPTSLEIEWVTSIEASWLTFPPTGWAFFTGTSFALFASGNGEPWPFDAEDVGFTKVEEVYGQDYYENYQS